MFRRTMFGLFQWLSWITVYVFQYFLSFCRASHGLIYSNYYWSAAQSTEVHSALWSVVLSRGDLQCSRMNTTATRPCRLTFWGVVGDFRRKEEVDMESRDVESSRHRAVRVWERRRRVCACVYQEGRGCVWVFVWVWWSHQLCAPPPLALGPQPWAPGPRSQTDKLPIISSNYAPSTEDVPPMLPLCGCDRFDCFVLWYIYSWLNKLLSFLSDFVLIYSRHPWRYSPLCGISRYS